MSDYDNTCDARPDDGYYTVHHFHGHDSTRMICCHCGDLFLADDNESGRCGPYTPESFPLSERDPLGFLREIGIQLREAVSRVDHGEAPPGWKRSGPGYRQVTDGNDGGFVTRGAAAFGRCWWPSTDDDFASAPASEHALEAIWQTQDPGWDERARGGHV